MSAKLVVGLDGGEVQTPALVYARNLATLIGDCELIVVYVIEWSPYSFQTAEENEQRHKRREQEIALANERVVDPVVSALSNEGFKTRGVVRHGNVADVLELVAREEDATQIIVARTSNQSLSSRIFGSSTANLVMHASVPVTVVN